MSVKRTASEAEIDETVPGSEYSDQLEITPLGGGAEVGRSCIVMKFKGKNIMLDCGVHPAHTGGDSLPFFDTIDLATIDLLLVTHFHLDHAAALPYLLEKTTFRGRVFMTHATKAIYKLMLTDFVKVSNVAIEDMLYTERDLVNSMERIEVINYHQELDVNGVKFTAFNAGHVLGAAMYLIEIAGVKILYTGDYSREEDRHLMSAETPAVQPDILMVESTYGVQVHEPRKDREARFTTVIHKVVKRGGRVLLPVFALGRAQELLLILDEYWAAHPELHSIPIYYASALAKKAMTVYSTYIGMMNERVQQMYRISNPFQFKHIHNLKGKDSFDDVGPSVVMASPGMLQSGLSRELFDMWCTDQKNAVIIAGYSVDGTLAKHIISSPREVSTLGGMVVPLKMGVHYISFSAHADFAQTSEFIDILKPPHIILVHGDSVEMTRLKQALVRRYEGQNIEVLTPKNGHSVRMKFAGETMAKVVGSLAKRRPVDMSLVAGIVVKKDFNHHVMAPVDLGTFTQLSTGKIMQRMSIPYRHPFALARYFLCQLFDPVTSATKSFGAETCESLMIHDAVSVTRRSDDELLLEWCAGPVPDMLADAVVAAVMNVEATPAAVKLSSGLLHSHGSSAPAFDSEKMLTTAQRVLSQRFGDVSVNFQDATLTVRVRSATAVINRKARTIECDDPALKSLIEETIRRIDLAVAPYRVDRVAAMVAPAKEEAVEMVVEAIEGSTSAAAATDVKPMEVS